VERVHAAGPIVKVELRTEFGDSLSAEISQQDHHDLALAKTEEVWVSPKQSRTFDTAEDYSI
jgi:hypothetical protein